jgi:ribosome-associated toxin RatA of RatAB toxin-antitoxin module
MAERTTSHISIAAPASQIMSVIADLEAYPEWTGSVKSVEILSVFDDEAERPAEATFVLDAGAIKDTYTLAYEWEDDTLVSWNLVRGEILTAMTGSYRLTDNGDGTTDVAYALELDIKIPMIGLLRRKAEKVITDTALKELQKRVSG